MTKNNRGGLSLTIFGIVGFFASFMLTYEKFMTLTNTGYTPACDINPLLSCGAAMGSWQGELFGFPNPILGIVGYAVVTTIGVLMLSGVSIPKWIRIGLWLGALAGQALIFFLMYTSLIVLGIICPWCFVVWIAQWPITVSTTADALRSSGGFGRVVNSQKFLIILVGYLLAAIAIVLTLGEQLRTLF